MRPLRDLERKGVKVEIIPCSSRGEFDPESIKKRIKKNTKLIVINHGSNVIGSILPICQIGEIARKHGILFLVDTAQTAGCYPLDMEKDKIDLLAFTGHKALFGPSGTGGLIFGERVNIKKLIPLKRGGTGSWSEFEEQPDFLPDKYESGTLNAVGIAGLNEGVKFILQEGVDKIHRYELLLTQKLIEGLKNIPEAIVYGAEKREDRVAVVSFNIQKRLPSEIGLKLDEEYGIMCRIGLHCSPASHKTIGTFPMGSVRFSLSYFNQWEEIEQALEAVKKIAKEGRKLK